MDEKVFARRPSTKNWMSNTNEYQNRLTAFSQIYKIWTNCLPDQLFESLHWILNKNWLVRCLLGWLITCTDDAHFALHRRVHQFHANRKALEGGFQIIRFRLTPIERSLFCSTKWSNIIFVIKLYFDMAFFLAWSELNSKKSLNDLFRVNSAPILPDNIFTNWIYKQ